MLMLKVDIESFGELFKQSGHVEIFCDSYDSEAQRTSDKLKLIIGVGRGFFHHLKSSIATLWAFGTGVVGVSHESNILNWDNFNRVAQTLYILSGPLSVGPHSFTSISAVL